MQNVLLGSGVNAFNITFNGNAIQAGAVQSSIQEFNYTGNVFPISNGLFLRTNTGSQAVYGDSDAERLMGQVSGIFSGPQNGTIIEFDFVPDGDTLSFNYIFASSEYTSFTCASYNDVFGFLLSGPGINGPFSNNAINLAVVPNSNNIPVGINTVNAGNPLDDNLGNCHSADPNWIANSVYYTTAYNNVFNSSGLDDAGFGMIFNGSTITLPANAKMVCGDTFHIKMLIANSSDESFDSGVFLEGGSFSSPGVEVSIEPDIITQATNVADNTLIEGCSEGTIYFSRPSNDVADTLVVHFTVGGTATEGTDYPPLAAGDSLVFLPGQDTIAIILAPFDDGIAEGPETVVIKTFYINACGDSIFSEGTIWIDDEPHSDFSATGEDILCFSTPSKGKAVTTGGFAPYTYTWDNGYTGDNVEMYFDENGTYDVVVTSTDACGFMYYDTLRINVNQTLNIDELISYETECGIETGMVEAFTSGKTGTAYYNWVGPGKNSSNDIDASVWDNLPSGWYYFTVEDQVCSVSDSVFVDQTPPPTAKFDADPTSGASPLDVTFTNKTKHVNGYVYIWDFGNGDGAFSNDLSDQYSTYYENGTYTATLTVFSGVCTDMASKVITVYPPLIYDTPNVFTPNGDGDNDNFTMNVQNAKALEVTIHNRWGNIVFESTDVNFYWNGKVRNSGGDCTEGTYFYKVKMEDYSGEEIEENGFIELLRGK